MCGKVLENELYVCKNCKREIEYVEEPVCKKCGKQLISSDEEYCSDCKKYNHEFIQQKAVFTYKGAVRESIYKYKYKNQRFFADFYIYEVMNLYGRWIESLRVDVIIPIPVHEDRRRKRGFNQTEKIAFGLGKKLSIPVRNDLLFRNKKTIAQKELNYLERRKNMKSAFEVYDEACYYTRVLLLDDIYTTGATMDEASQALKKFGIKKIFCLSICIGNI